MKYYTPEKYKLINDWLHFLTGVAAGIAISQAYL